MQNLSKKISQPMILWGGVALFVVVGIIFLISSFGGGEDAPSADVNAIYTNAAMTIEVQQKTMEAAMTSLVSNSPTALTPTASLTPLPSPTISLLQPFATTANPVANTSGCDNSAYVSDVTIPDGTAVALGQSFTKTWRLSNSGSCTWSATYQIIFISGEGMTGKSTPIGKVVAPGQVGDVSVALVAPTKAGDYTGIWRLMNDKAQAFGGTFTVVIKAGGATITGTPPTATSTTGSNNNTATKTNTAPSATASLTTVPPSATTAPPPSETPTETPTTGP